MPDKDDGKNLGQKNADVTASDGKNLEEVEVTLQQIRGEKQLNGKKSTLRSIFGYVFFPFIMLWRGLKRIAARIRIPITVKTTLIYTLLFTVALVLIDVFIVSSVSDHLESLGLRGDGYIGTLILTSAALIIISVAVVAALGSLASQSMLSPIRRMIKRIDKISGDNLSTRLDDVDSQDELRELTERINKMLDNLEQSFDRQKKFVSDASHELKTPISVIQGYSNLLLRWGKSDPAVLDESLESIAREADNMKRIVEQLLLLAKIGRYMFSPEDVELSAELAAVMDGYALVCKTHKFEFVSEGEVVAKIDKNMFTECVRAVIDNAVKYSEDNTAVTVTLTSEDGYAVIKIADCGYGISEADLPHIFDRFYRCDKSRNRDAHSSGLGLTIAKSIVEMMGGTIEVESRLKIGSVFTLRFPIKEGADE